MTDSSPRRRVVRFGVFEVDLQAGELHRHGLKIKLQEKPFQVLALLLDHPGVVVSREELQRRLWPTDTFVDFDHSLNTAVTKLREALGDSADTPRYVETLQRRGYRFIYPLEEPRAPTARPRPRIGSRSIAALALVALASGLIGLNFGKVRDWLGVGPAPGEISSIAVLPLANLSGDPEQDYFADGMTEALITELGKISALRVISRQSVMQYKGTHKPLPEIATELKVDAVVEGSALREGDRVRITAQLVRAVPEKHLWAENYEREFTNVLRLQSDLARAIAGEIRIAVTPAERVRLASARSINPEAYEAYLKGRAEWNKRTEEGMRKAIRHFEQAIEREPDYSLGYAGLADACLVGSAYGFLPREDADSRAKQAALRALELDDTLAEAHTSLAGVFRKELDWKGVERQLQRAIELNPSYAAAHHWYSAHLSSFGRLEEALDEATLAHELDPGSLAISVTVGETLFFMRRFDQAIEQYRLTLELDPDYYIAYSDLGLAFQQKGMYEEAIAMCQKAVALSGNNPTQIALLGHTYAVAGRRAEGLKILAELKDLSTQKNVPPWSFAVVHIGLGQKDKAFEWLDMAYEEYPSDLVLLNAELFYDPLRTDPRFQDLLRRMNFPE